MSDEFDPANLAADQIQRQSPGDAERDAIAERFVQKRLAAREIEPDWPDYPD